MNHADLPSYGCFLINGKLCSFSSPTTVNDVKLNEPCLGAYGGPVNPNIALGGFNGTAYENATTMIITFVVNNYQDKRKLGKAMAWEKAFLEYMKEYVQNSSNGNLTISFTAERAIQDELDRESDTDIITIFVSYMIMFLYITVALGQFKSCSRILVSKEFFAKDFFKMQLFFFQLGMIYTWYIK